jgi:hypothetical protein
MKNRNNLISFPLFLLIQIFIITACEGQGEDISTAPTEPTFNQISPTNQPLLSTAAVSAGDESVTRESENGSLETQSVPTSTPDNRLPPEEWQTWPVIPTLSPAMLEVYRQGLALGNRPDAFSKVGDCQNIPDVFLGLYDNEGGYLLPKELSHLEETIENFEGSFGREGMALKGGFVFPTVFSPLRADASVCNPGETPLECELRVHQPSFVLISMEFRYEGRTAETHEKYLRRSVEYALSRGIVPILATKADNFEGDHSLNRTTAEIAYEYDLPLWNGWLAVQHLPDHGIDWERDSYGFHITPAAWHERSETFLQVLDALWKQAQSAVEARGDS